MSKLRVICDFDGVIVDIMPQWCAALRAIGFTDCKPSNITKYAMLENACLGGCTEKQLMEALKQVNYARTLERSELLPFVESKLLTLTIQHDFTFVSCQPVDADRQMASKQFVLDVILGTSAHKVHHHAGGMDRVALDGDVLIDDRLDVIQAWCARGLDKHGLLMNASYNAGDLPVNATRVYDWVVIEHALEKLAKQAATLSAVAAAKTTPVRRYFGLPPDNHPDRKEFDPFNGCLAFFPDALAEVARISTTAGRKYNNGHTAWHVEKGGDRHASLGRHALDIAKMRGKLGEPGWADKHGEEAIVAYAAAIWDLCAPLQQLIERLNASKGDS